MPSQAEPEQAALVAAASASPVAAEAWCTVTDRLRRLRADLEVPTPYRDLEYRATSVIVAAHLNQVFRMVQDVRPQADLAADPGDIA